MVSAGSFVGVAAHSAASPEHTPNGAAGRSALSNAHGARGPT
jgi:hypothetical protein